MWCRSKQLWVKQHECDVNPEIMRTLIWNQTHMQQQQKEKKYTHECNGSSPLVTPQLLKVGLGVNRRRQQKGQRWLCPISSAGWEMRMKELFGEGAGRWQCLCTVTNQNQDSLQQRKESGLLRSESWHELLYLWEGKKRLSLWLRFFTLSFSKTFMC